MLSSIEQASLKYYSIYGGNPECGYWEKNPYSAAGNGAVCVSHSETGVCNGWKLRDGSDLPSDYNGFFDDCTKLWQSFYKTMNVQKICRNNAYANGCIPEYKGRDTLYGGKNPDKSDYEINSAVASSGFMKSAILSGSAIVLTDGSIIFSYMHESTRYFAVDVNGKKGPNKWGTDVYLVKPTMRNSTSVPIFKFDNSMLDSGGISSTSLLYEQ